MHRRWTCTAGLILSATVSGCTGTGGGGADSIENVGDNRNENTSTPPLPPLRTPEPVSGHPRLWVTEADVDRLRSWAVEANPVYGQGLALLAQEAKAEMDAGNVPGMDSGSNDWEEFPTELFAELFAFMSLIENEERVRNDYAARARGCLMHVMDEAAKGSAEGQPFRDPEFYTSDSNRARWTGEGYALATDWIYPYLTEEDKATIRRVFLRWSEEIINYAYPQPPQPVGVLNDPVLISDSAAVRWAGNNYFTAHMRNLGLMAMALDEDDDPDGTLRAYIQNATGAWMYIVDHLLKTDAAGGQAPEGFEYSPQTIAYVAQFLLALHTAGLDDPEVFGSQVALRDQVFWDDMVTAYFHALSPVPRIHEWMGTLYEPAWYGDGQNYYAPDFIALFGPLGLYDHSTGSATRLEALRWAELHMAPGGEEELLDRVGNTDNFLASIMYFLLMDPEAADPTDPRPSLPLEHYAPGVGHVLARTGWDDRASWFNFNCGYVSIDHQHGDGNQFEFYRNGEWLTKERTGYGDNIGCSDYHNTLALENDRPDHDEPGDPRAIAWERGSQWLYGVASGPGRILAHSFGEGYVYALGDATELYNSEYEATTDILQASRSIVWLKPDHIVVYDRAESRTSGRFKRFWLNLPADADVSGRRARMNTAGGQSLAVASLLPEGAVMTTEPAEALEESGEPANDDPTRFRLRVEAPGGSATARFLHVLQGVDGGQPTDPVQLIESGSGTPYAGSAVGEFLVLFPVELGATFAGVTYTAPAETAVHLITGLVPNESYDVSTESDERGLNVSIRESADQQADSGGVLVINFGG